MEKCDGHSSTARTAEYPHPFVHHVKLTKAQRIRGIILGSILFPLRMALVAICFLLIWLPARLRFAGLSEEERSRPVTGWRRWLLHSIVWLLTRAVFFSMGFWVKVKGRMADLREAPVLVVAPHSSFLDIVVTCPTQLATVVSREENKSLPVIGALLEFNQAVIVSRKDPASRRKAIFQITERLTSNGYWPQMLMFPEGTTTNGQALIKFKPGAFLGGVPVQPVLLHYPNQLDTVRWTYEGTSIVDVLWHTASQFYTNVTVEFLPVYHPSQEEKNDPNLYAANVQTLMAKSLGVPATDYVMEGRVPVSKLGGLSLPVEPPARVALSLLRPHRLGGSGMLEALSGAIDEWRAGARGWKVDAQELAAILGLKEIWTASKICALYSKDDLVDLRHLYLSVAAVAGTLAFKALFHTAFDMFDQEGRGSLTADELPDLMGALLGIPQHNTAPLFTVASRKGLLSEEDLLGVLTSHPTYQRVVNEYLQPEEAGSLPPYTPFTNVNIVNNNGDMTNGNGTHFSTKKAE